LVAKSALRVLEMLDHIARQREGCTHTDVARALDIPKSSVTVLLRDLVSTGYARFEEATGRYHIGSSVLTLSNAYLRGLNLVKLAQPAVTELFMQVHEFAALAIPKGHEYIIVCAESPPVPLAHSLQIGERGPMLGSASGKAILSTWPVEQVGEFLNGTRVVAHTGKTVTDKRKVRAEIEEVRAAGIAFSRDEAIPGVTAIAAPVRGADGMAVAAVSVALATSRVTDKLERQITQAVKASGRRLSTQLGWTG
jgi:DNA-binding IclR family transcriptional regulator